MDRDLAATLARYSALAYGSPADLRAALPDAEIAFFDRDATQAYAIRRAGHSALVFRGTQVFSGFSPADVLSNLWVRRRPWDPGKVHGGYLEALLDVVAEVKAQLHDAPRPLYFDGHSMGGALATLAATLTPGPDATYSFGAPRVGDAAFAAALDGVVRVVNGDDIAPRYPLPLGYRHGGAAWHLSDDGRLRPGPDLWRRIVRAPVTPRRFARAVLDHRVEEYRRKLATRAA